MPLMPPGNALFRAYMDDQRKYHAVYIGPAPVVCDFCRRETYVNRVGGRCPWCRLPQRLWRHWPPFGITPTNNSGAR